MKRWHVEQAFVICSNILRVSGVAAFGVSREMRLYSLPTEG